LGETNRIGQQPQPPAAGTLASDWITINGHTVRVPRCPPGDLADELSCLLGRAACAEMVLRAATAEMARMAKRERRPPPGPWKMLVVAGLAGGVSWRAPDGRV
jgi:hypothetical protein